MTDTEDFFEQLRRDGVVRSAEARFTALTGGVSCDIFLVDDGGDRFVVKRALPKLKVEADWFADVNRNRHEWLYLRYVGKFMPQAVPRLRPTAAGDGYFAMEHLGDGFANWKQLLLRGECSAVHAASAAEILATIHTRSAGDAEAARDFDTTSNFMQLRIEPYLLATGSKHPALQPLFAAEATRLQHTRECLVHGDFSPKNILVSDIRMVLLDCEVAWYGDPAFDLAFLLTHLFLKSLRQAPHEVGLQPMIHAFIGRYQAARPSPALLPRVGRLLLMLLLARVDGKSPVEYLDEPRRQFVREFVSLTLPADHFQPAEITAAWFAQLTRFAP